MTASEISNTTYMALVDILENEADWPQMSTTTGHTITNWMGTPANPVSSMYLYGRKQNQCTHRDYQNIGVNGARSTSMAHGIVQTLKRNPVTDHPMIVSFALIGNDVCNGHYGTGDMTTPQEFYQAVMESLNYLNTKLPVGSYVVFFGLVDGRILWDAMHDRIHPIGSTNNNVDYATVYEYLACLEISPCWGWLNPDAYWRNATSQRAMELNQVYMDIVANTTFSNFEMLYFPTPLPNIIGMWGALGGDVWQLIEPIDGFHPDQRANALLAQYQWGLYLTNYTQLVPPKNPYNDDITDLFLDQGGY
jgi:acyloxyacyl hydrolase